MQSEIKRWGNSAALRLSTKILAQAELSISSPVEITVEAGKIIIQAAPEKTSRVRFPYTEKELLQGLGPETAHADALAPLTSSEIGD